MSHPSRLSGLLNPLKTLVAQHPLRASAVASAPLLIYALRALYTDYQSFLALGRGGLPHNVLGWFASWLLRPLGRADTRSLAPYSSSQIAKQYGSLANTSFLGSLPPRAGATPTVPTRVAPQRQTTQMVYDEVSELQAASIAAIATANPSLLAVRTSRLERRGPALWLADGLPVPDWAAATRGETAHVHSGGDGSAHVLLLPRDAREVLAQGWGERHMLSGTLMPVTYTLVYAPRTAAEVDIVARIYRAAVRAMTGGAEVR